MIITRDYARRLVREGKAIEDGIVRENEWEHWVSITRYDLQRTDHYKPIPKDFDRFRRGEQ